MNIVMHDHFHDARKVKATQLIVYDDFENPLAILIELDNNVVGIYRSVDPEFADVLQSLDVKNVATTSKIVQSVGNQLKFVPITRDHK